jgi:hypothetical protein
VAIPGYRYRIVTLWDLMRPFRAAPYLYLADVLALTRFSKETEQHAASMERIRETVTRLAPTHAAATLLEAVASIQPATRVIEENQRREGEQIFSDLETECTALDLTCSLATVKRIRAAFSKPGCRFSDIIPLGDELSGRLKDEMEARCFFSLAPDDVSFYEQKSPLFGSEVEQKFSQMSEDISEAGKCLALDRSTGAVFHLMRVMELGVQTLGDKLGVQLASEKNWQVILDGINKQIKALDQKAAQTKAYAAASSHLYNVKLAWRNEVMHPKQTYTRDEARKIFDAVDAFMRDLASML